MERAYIDRLPADGFVRIADLVRMGSRANDTATLRPILPISRSQLYRMVRSGEFPAPLYLGRSARMVAWRVQDVRAWIEAQATSAPREPHPRLIEARRIREPKAQAEHGRQDGARPDA